MFENILNTILTKVDKTKKVTYLTGDFNIDLLKSDHCEHSNRFCEQLFTSSFFPLINRPTRITHHTATLIDNIFTNDLEQIESSVNGLIFSDISDHLPIFHVASLPTNQNCHKTENTLYKRIFNKDSLDSFLLWVKNTSWESTFDANDPCESYMRFHNNLKIAINKSFPFVKIRNKVVNNTKSPWMTNGIFKSISKKNKLYKKFLKKPTRKNETDYKKYKNKLNHVIKNAKKAYYEKQFVKYKNNTKKTWQTINEILNINRTSKDLPDTFLHKNSKNSVTNPQKIADKFNEYFVNIGPQLEKKIPKHDNFTYERYLNGNYTDSMFIEPVTEYELQMEINNLNENKSAGHDEISAKMIKTIGKEIVKPLTYIFNLPFQTGKIPKFLKIALITPIFKANESNLFENYRPISVLTCFSKLLEKLMYKRFYNYVEKHQILSEHQFGFRSNRSTEHAILELSNKISKAIDKGEYTIGVFLDLSKAFDTVNHGILLKKLQHYGIRGICLQWFTNYLQERTQIVKFKQYRSAEMNVMTGVPQGSILGPLLFLIYINDIENCSNIFSFILYADDTNALYSNSSLNTLVNIIQKEMNKIVEWLNANKLSINTSKTKFIIFKSKNKFLPQQITFELNDHIIKQASYVKFLGVIIDQDFTWKNHISLVLKNIIKFTGLIAKLRHFTNKNTLKLAYYALVYPYLTYGNIVWGNTYPTRLQKLLNVQKKIVRLINFKSYMDHSEPSFKYLKILNIYQINDYLCSLFMFRFNYCQNMPDLFDDYFKQNNALHKHNTRNSTKLHMSYNRTNYRTYTIFHKGVLIWNVLNEEIKNTKTYYSFKKKAKFHYLMM